MRTREYPAYESVEQADTNNATRIGWQERTEHYDPDQTWMDDRYPRRYGDWYQHKDLTNNGYQNYNWVNKPFYRWLENVRLIGACSTQLPLTKRERGHAVGLFTRLPAQKFGTHKEIYAVATCLYVVEFNGLDERRAHPNVTDERKPAEFRLGPVSEQFGVSEKRLRKAYGRIEYWDRTDELGPPPVFDKYDEDSLIEYKDSMAEGWFGTRGEGGIYRVNH